MKRIISTALFLSTPLLAALHLTGCVGIPMVGMPDNSAMMADNDLLQQKQKITMGFQSSPDTDAWHEQRQKLSLAAGDRVFDKDFARVYDSLVLALSTMELKVGNMERTSGYIQATGIALAPTESKAMHHDAVRDWCQQRGFDPNIPDQKFAQPYWEKQFGGLADNSAGMAGMMGQPAKAQKGLTFQLAKMGDNQTKVKLRFSDVYYPPEMEAYYKLVWQAVDKQIFVDKNVEGAVEQRK